MKGLDLKDSNLPTESVTPYARVHRRKNALKNIIETDEIPMQYLITSNLAASSCVFRECISCSIHEPIN